MKLLTVIVNFRTPDMSADAVDAAVRALEHVEGAQWSVALVDNDSQDGSYDRLLEHRETRGWSERVSVMQSGHNGGFGSGNNFAIREALASDDPPDYVYLLNSDASPADDAIARLLTYLEQHPAVGIAGSYIHGFDGEPHMTVFRFPSVTSELVESLRVGPVTRALSEHVVGRPIPDEDILVDWVAGCSMMMRREVLDAVGLFDETFFLYYEETDLCRRAALAGFETAYVRSSHVAHIGSVSTGMKTWKRMPGFWFDSRRYYFTKQHGERYFWGTTAARLVGGSLHRLRCAITGRPVDEPKRHLRDMIAHSARTRGTGDT